MKYTDFQEATIKRVIELYEKGIQRVLVADEVGLGKTIIARGVIDYLLKKDESRKIVYICSNQMIAAQNVKRLINEKKMISPNTRLSMLHLEIMKNEKRTKIFPITPDTSFNITKKNQGGIVEERALMYAVLEALLKKKNVSGYNNFLKGNRITNEIYWKSLINKYQKEIDKVDNNGKYLDKIRHAMLKIMKKKVSLKNDSNRFIKEVINYLKNTLGKDIANWRLFFMKISLEFFKADFVIMDEFQRFSNVFLNQDKNSEMNCLIDKFLKNEETKILLLSATPYKIYSTFEEVIENNENPYEEFINVVQFLKRYDDNFEKIWKIYSDTLNQICIDDKNKFLKIKNNVEKALYDNICRTERNSSFNTEQILQKKYDVRMLKITSKDIESYAKLAQVLAMDENSQGVSLPIDYIKSCPFLLSFIKEYQLDTIISNLKKKNELKKSLFYCNENKILQYEELDGLKDNNAKFSEVKNILLPDNDKKNSKNPELLLWIPPSLPYYKTNGVFYRAKHFSKTLIFSSWQMVPRMISTLISYEAERKTIGEVAKKQRVEDPPYNNRDDIVDTLSNREKEIIALCYPSQYLAELYSPLEYYNWSIEDIRKELKKKIKKDIKNILKYQGNSKKRKDDNWYVLAPLLLDDENYFKNNFFNLIDDDNKNNEIKGVRRGVGKIKHLYDEIGEEKSKKMGKMPEDLVDYLVDMAIASPSVVMLRILNSLFRDENISERIKFAVLTANSLKNYLNLPESAAVINLVALQKKDKAEKKDKSFVREVLYYCQEGNLQAMLEEYIHILEYENINIESLCGMIMSSVSLKTSSYQIECIKNNAFKKLKIRSHYAVSFLADDSNESEFKRTENVRNVFNAPFRPFVLTTTSIGQEGLDFHNYCRQIIHWNLPSNPIDLEQREGRVVRYKNLAVRQNIAKRYGKNISKKDKDIWNCLFEYAKDAESNKKTSHLIPYWQVKEIDNNTIPVEQIIPVYPLSRDRAIYERLIKLMAAYRLSLGQINQEELLEALMQKFKVEKLKDYFMNLSPYFRGK